jgi:hypothetical protein
MLAPERAKTTCDSNESDRSPQKSYRDKHPSLPRCKANDYALIGRLVVENVGLSVLGLHQAHLTGCQRCIALQGFDILLLVHSLELSRDFRFWRGHSGIRGIEVLALARRGDVVVARIHDLAAPRDDPLHKSNFLAQK